MDSITHIVLGACIGEAVLDKRIGKKALVIGAAAQSIPDLDFIASFWMTPARELLAHRGITHSLLFVLLLSPLLGIIFHKLLKKRVPAVLLTAFFLLELLVHIFLDAFNNYGVGWFEPFNHLRVSFNTIYVADVLMIIVPLTATIALFLHPINHKRRRAWARFSIIFCAAYLAIASFNKYYISSQAADAEVSQSLSHKYYFTTPAPLQSMLWMVVTGDDNGYYVSYRSVFDSKSKPYQFTYFPRNEHYLDSLDDHPDIGYLKRFSNGFYTVEKWGDTLVFNDLRFGQIIGWQNPKERFVFHYFVQHPEENKIVVQRGRFAKWNWRVIKLFIRRVFGG